MIMADDDRPGMAADWTEFAPGVFVAIAAPAWAYEVGTGPLGPGIDGREYDRSARLAAEAFGEADASRFELWRATLAYTESGRLVPIAEITRDDPSVLVTAEGWPRWVRARLTRPPRRPKAVMPADGQETLPISPDDAEAIP